MMQAWIGTVTTDQMSDVLAPALNLQPGEDVQDIITITAVRMTDGRLRTVVGSERSLPDLITRLCDVTERLVMEDRPDFLPTVTEAEFAAREAYQEVTGYG